MKFKTSCVYTLLEVSSILQVCDWLRLLQTDRRRRFPTQVCDNRGSTCIAWGSMTPHRWLNVVVVKCGCGYMWLSLNGCG